MLYAVEKYAYTEFWLAQCNFLYIFLMIGMVMSLHGIERAKVVLKY
jgi:hypothetical protein